MATGISWPSIGGSAYSIPAAGEVGWPALSNFLIALSSAQGTAAQKIGMRTATTSPVTVAGVDCAICVALTVPGAAIVQLPAGIVGQYYAIIDGNGDSATNNITVNPNGAETINGAASYVLESNFACVILCFQGAGKWRIIAQFSTDIGGTVARADIAAGTPNYVVINGGTGLLSEEAQLSQTRGGFGTNTAAFTGVVKATAGVFSASAIVDADISASAAIDPLKIAPGTISSAEFGALDNISGNIQAQINATQPLDSDLTALAALSTTGLIVRTGAGAVTTRAIAGTTNRIGVTNGDGVSGAPTLDIGSDVVTLTGTQILTNKTIGISNTVTLIDTLFRLQDDGDPTKQLSWQLSGITTATTRTWTVQDASGSVALLSNTLNQFGSTTSAQLASVISDETGSGALVFGTSPTIGTAIINSPTLAGGTASNTSRWTVPSGTLSALTALTRVAGVIVYATDTQKFYSDDGTNLNEVGSGSSGGINYILAPSTATGWTRVGTTGAAGNAPVTTTTTGDLPLTPVVNTAIKLLSATSAAAETVAYVSYPFTTPPTGAVKTQVSMFLRPGTNFIAGEWTVSIYQSTTRQSLSIDSGGQTLIPNQTGQFSFSFDALASTAYTLRFARIVNAGVNAAQLNLAQVYVGPGILDQGAAVGPWVSYSPTGSWVSNTTYTGRWRQVGDTMDCQVYVSVSGAPTATTLTVTLPTGYTANTSAFASIVVGETTLGNATILDNGTAYFLGSVVYVNTTTVQVNLNNALSVTSVSPMTWASGDGVFLKFSVPIAEWAGSGTLNIGAGAQVEYASSTTGTWDAAAAAGNTVYGTAGSPISGSLTAARSKVVKFQYPVQAGDRIVLQYQYTSGVWVDAGESNVTLVNMPSISFGAYVSAIANGTDVTVSFSRWCITGTVYNDAAGTGATNWGAAGTPTAWRLIKANPSSPVGFGLAGLDGSSGLYKAGFAPGSVTGVAIAAGYIGEELLVTAGAGPYGTTSVADAWTNASGMGTLTLTAGAWELSYSVCGEAIKSSAIGNVFANVRIFNSTDASAVTNSISLLGGYMGTVGGAFYGTMARTVRVNLSSSKTFQLETRCSGATATAAFSILGTTYSGGLTDPDSNSVFRAVRIA